MPAEPHYNCKHWSLDNYSNSDGEHHRCDNSTSGVDHDCCTPLLSLPVMVDGHWWAMQRIQPPTPRPQETIFNNFTYSTYPIMALSECAGQCVRAKRGREYSRWRCKRAWLGSLEQMAQHLRHGGAPLRAHTLIHGISFPMYDLHEGERKRSFSPYQIREAIRTLARLSFMGT